MHRFPSIYLNNIRKHVWNKRYPFIENDFLIFVKSYFLLNFDKLIIVINKLKRNTVLKCGEKVVSMFGKALR